MLYVYMYKDESRFRMTSVVRNLKNDIILEKTYATKNKPSETHDYQKHMTAQYPGTG